MAVGLRRSMMIMLMLRTIAGDGLEWRGGKEERRRGGEKVEG